MANAFLKAETIAATSLGLLERELILASLVWNNAGFDFTGAKADTVTVRVPAQLTAREYEWRNDRKADIVLDELAEDSINVQLNKDIYSAVAVTDEELSLDIKDFGTQVLAPQVNAVAKALDAGVATLIEGAPYANTLPLDAKDPYTSVVKARTTLNKSFVPKADRVLLVGSDVEEKLLLSDRFIRADSTGEADAASALHEATIGKVAGFRVVSSEVINPASAYAFVPSAFVLATRAPAIPSGVTFGASQSYNGLSMRWIRDYDAAKLRDRSIVNLYAGFNAMLDKVGNAKKLVRAVKLNMSDPTPTS
ncbi:hypothetical protein I5Q34_19860 [Streptomyces sp. AV19]|uniref:P22 phage major capsid protein family protein n=1 Tax=Streptomyces sp. AV19 TaxID=2793068 RepID=UPI0018FE7140|nr:P22 phage major capsid protein family protein [Streptomyces sp. AV19]MBH1936505.1 hypothetical protein [Streptomyces sp. AV19]MDG4532562.1 hypothetical protein [Streptomyces sp. AV19]